VHDRSRPSSDPSSSRLLACRMAADLDAVDVALLRELQGDGRLSFRQLAGRVGLSPPATAERVRRLEASGILQGYRAVVSPAAIGRGLEAFVRIRPTDNAAAAAITTMLADTGAVRELHHLVGEDCFLLRIAVADIPELEVFLSRVSHHGTSNTSIVLSSPVTFMPVFPPTQKARAVSHPDLHERPRETRKANDARGPGPPRRRRP